MESSFNLQSKFKKIEEVGDREGVNSAHHDPNDPNNPVTTESVIEKLVSLY